MSTVTIRDIPVAFPFEPYDIQKEYMEKVIECLQEETNGVLESPTGTGKTLSLLCASLAWLTAKKATLQANYHLMKPQAERNDFLKALNDDVSLQAGTSKKSNGRMFGAPTIIYASRTHSQLSQAMQELKRTAYSNMKAVVIGSREQMCVHPEVTKEESNSAKIHMCRLKVQGRSCHFYNRVEKLKDDASISEVPVMDIEDLVSLGTKRGFCPYFMSKELSDVADIVFMPYNYVIDFKTKRSTGNIQLDNAVIILDEAHNIERICEDSASTQVTSADITLCIDEVTEVMKAFTEGPAEFTEEEPLDFSAEDLCTIKQMLLDFEKALDGIELKLKEGVTFDGDYIFEVFGKAGINFTNHYQLESMLEKMIQFLQTTKNGPFQRKGNGLMVFESLLKLAFISPSPQMKEKIKKCYKVHVAMEEPSSRKPSNDWFSKGESSRSSKGRILSYWCFSPGFGMAMLMGSNIRCVILTSGTLAPLKALISELELSAPVRLENPHIVDSNQIAVRIVSKGPDGVELNSSFQNRNKPEYLSSLGCTILNLSRIIPNGLLIFFPSYPVMQKCQQHWQEDGIWGNIADQKAIYVEPKQKEAFNTAMSEYYARIQNPQYKGAIFMGVCRGKVSEGLDFADANGRAVIITGLPYPPLKEPRVVLKREYLNVCRLQDKEYLSGDDWYSLEATRAVNQAMGRVIRHRRDYGAIILLDSRFVNFRLRSQMSLWIRNRIKMVNNFGEIVRDLRGFFRYADANLNITQPNPPAITIVTPQPAKFDTTGACCKGNFDFSTSTTCSVLNSGDNSLPSASAVNSVTIYNTKVNAVAGVKRKRITIISSNGSTSTAAPKETDIHKYITVVKNTLDPQDFKTFITALKMYRDTEEFDQLVSQLDKIFFNKFNLRYIIQGLSPYIKDRHRDNFENYWEKMR